MILKADQIVTVSPQILLPELKNSIRSFPGSGIVQAHRLHWAKAQSIDASTRHLFDRKASLKVGGAFAAVQRNRFSPNEGLIKRQVFFFVEWAVDKIRLPFVIARCPIDFRIIDGVGVHDGADGIIKIEMAFAGKFADRAGKPFRGEGARGNY